MGSALKITNKEFAQRRVELMSLMEENSIAILPSAVEQSRNSDVNHHFRQNSDFHYLTGFDEADSVFVLVPGREHGECILFCRERDPEMEQWHGKITGPERAMQLYGIDDAFPMADIDDILPGLIEGKSKLYYAMGSHREFDTRVIAWTSSISSNQNSGSRPPGEFVQIDQYLHDLRLFKSKHEIQVMKRASEITADAHKRLMSFVKPGQYEYQLEAELLHSFASNGARHAAYPSIVGAGNNGCILHYIDNDGLIADGDLVLVDAGCEFESYAADVTRTFPANGKFSEPQKALYNIVLAAQDAAIELIKPGNHWDQPHLAAVHVITKGLVELGLLEGEVKDLVDNEAYKKFYMHRTGHWLGLDVHDVGEYRFEDQWRVFEAGMVTTVEPGIYIDEGLSDVPRQYRGIGIRIEDNVLVTTKGNEVITSTIPRTVQEVEAYMSKSRASD
ncbi:MAG: Xaa-Pro aminopeptidase [Pseudomonadales bacterium]|nr:Xaa-Pro aminopeptidase [Pseudomonadales bacterium]MDG1442491.1 Xaa-Pro aminopeptidase [Pseudomonadales bacterium]